MAKQPYTTEVDRLLRKWGRKVLNRPQWGGNALFYRRRIETRPHAPMPADTVWIHITVTKDTGRLGSDMRTLDRIGRERFGSGVSYNWCVAMRKGNIGLGQSLEASGSHTVNTKGVKGFSYNQNKVAHAIAFIGMPGDKPSEEAIDSAAYILALMKWTGAVTKDPDVLPHRYVAPKDCPTDAIVDIIPEIVIRADRLIEGWSKGVAPRRYPFLPKGA